MPTLTPVLLVGADEAAFKGPYGLCGRLRDWFGMDVVQHWERRPNPNGVPPAVKRVLVVKDQVSHGLVEALPKKESSLYVPRTFIFQRSWQKTCASLEKDGFALLPRRRGQEDADTVVMQMVVVGVTQNEWEQGPWPAMAMDYGMGVYDFWNDARTVPHEVPNEVQCLLIHAHAPSTLRDLVVQRCRQRSAPPPIVNLVENLQKVRERMLKAGFVPRETPPVESMSEPSPPVVSHPARKPAPDPLPIFLRLLARDPAVSREALTGAYNEALLSAGRAPVKSAHSVSSTISTAFCKMGIRRHAQLPVTVDMETYHETCVSIGEQPLKEAVGFQWGTTTATVKDRTPKPRRNAAVHPRQTRNRPYLPSGLRSYAPHTSAYQILNVCLEALQQVPLPSTQEVLEQVNLMRVRVGKPLLRRTTSIGRELARARLRMAERSAILVATPAPAMVTTSRTQVYPDHLPSSTTTTAPPVQIPAPSPHWRSESSFNGDLLPMLIEWMNRHDLVHVTVTREGKVKVGRKVVVEEEA